jgi:hypothetical protein
MIAAIMQPSEPENRATVKIGDRDYPLKFRHKDIVRLKKDHGINIGSRVTGEQIIEFMPAIISAGLAHLGTEAPPDVADYIGNLEYGELSLYTLAFIEAQKKASPQAKAANETLKLMAEEMQAKAAVEAELKPNGKIAETIQ